MWTREITFQARPLAGGKFEASPPFSIPYVRMQKLHPQDVYYVFSPNDPAQSSAAERPPLSTPRSPPHPDISGRLNNCLSYPRIVQLYNVKVCRTPSLPLPPFFSCAYLQLSWTYSSKDDDYRLAAVSGDGKVKARTATAVDSEKCALEGGFTRVVRFYAQR